MMSTSERPGFFKRTAWFWVLILAGMVLDLMAWGMASVSGYKLSSSMAPFTIFLPMMTLLNPVLALSRRLRHTDKVTPEPELTAISAELCARAGVEPLPVQILAEKEFPKKVNAFLRDQSIMLSNTAYLEFTRPEVEFIIAHEIAHKEQKQNSVLSPSEAKVLGVIILCMLFSISWLRVDSPLWIQFAPAVICSAIALSIRPYREMFATGKIELACDRRAVELTGNVDTAVSALQRLHSKVKPIDVKLGGYPSLEQRIAAVRSAITPVAEEA